MKKTMISSLMLIGMMAFSANAADFGGKIYVEEATIAPGETAVLSIQLDNMIDVSGFQFQMMLPVGITYQDWAVSEERLPAGASAKNVISMHRINDGKLTIAGVLNYSVDASFTKAQGELATVTIVASSNIPQGAYIIELRGIDICDTMGNDYDVPSTTFTLTVGEPSGIETIHYGSSNAQVYDLQGRHQKEVSLGQAGIVNGRTIYRK